MKKVCSKRVMMSRTRHNARPQATSLGGGGRLGYFARKALVNLRNNRLVSLITICTITIALLIISMFMLIYVNMEGTIDQWSSKVAVTVYLETPALKLCCISAWLRGRL